MFAEWIESYSRRHWGLIHIVVQKLLNISFWLFNNKEADKLFALHLCKDRTEHTLAACKMKMFQSNTHPIPDQKTIQKKMTYSTCENTKIGAKISITTVR